MSGVKEQAGGAIEEEWAPGLHLQGVGRILKYVKGRGLLKEPPWHTISARKRRPARPYAIRKPKGY